MQRQRIGVNRPAGKVAHAARVRVVLVGVDDAVRVGDDQLVGVVAREVREHRTRVAVAAHLDGEAFEQVLVAVQEGLAAVLAGHHRAGHATGALHHHADREGVGQRVGAPVGCLRAAAVFVARERGRFAGREHGLQRRRRDVRQQAFEGAVVCRRAVAPGRRHRCEVTAGGGGRVVGLGAGGDFDAAGVAGARVDIAVDGDRRLRRVELFEPFRRGDVGLRRDPALCGCFDGLVGVDAPVAVDLVEALARGIAEGVGQRTLDATFLVSGKRRVEVGVGARRRHADAARRFGLLGDVDVVRLAAFAGVTRCCA